MFEEIKLLFVKVLTDSILVFSFIFLSAVLISYLWDSSAVYYLMMSVI